MEEGSSQRTEDRRQRLAAILLRGAKRHADLRFKMEEERFKREHGGVPPPRWRGCAAIQD
jgi:hypothetical protein